MWQTTNNATLMTKKFSLKRDHGGNEMKDFGGILIASFIARPPLRQYSTFQIETKLLDSLRYYLLYSVPMFGVTINSERWLRKTLQQNINFQQSILRNRKVGNSLSLALSLCILYHIYLILNFLSIVIWRGCTLQWRNEISIFALSNFWH